MKRVKIQKRGMFDTTEIKFTLERLACGTRKSEGKQAVLNALKKTYIDFTNGKCSNLIGGNMQAQPITSEIILISRMIQQVLCLDHYVHFTSKPDSPLHNCDVKVITV